MRNSTGHQISGSALSCQRKQNAQPASRSNSMMLLHLLLTPPRILAIFNAIR